MRAGERPVGRSADWRGRLPRLAVWLLVPALGLSLAWWTWRLMPLKPGVGAGTAAPVSAGMPAVSGQGWFGAAATPSAASSGRFTLRWVYGGRPGVCILAMPGLADRAFAVGEEVEPGLRLVETGRDYAILEGQGRRERLELPPERAFTFGGGTQPASQPPASRGQPPAILPGAGTGTPPGPLNDSRRDH